MKKAHESLARWDIQHPFVQRVTVQPEHIDGFGHTNNVVYLGWCEGVAWAHSQSLGMALADYERIGAGCVARRHELDYLLPTFKDEELLIATWIAENDGKTSMWRAYQIIRARDGKTVLRGRTHWVCVDMKSGRPRRQPAEFLKAYQPYQEPKAEIPVADCPSPVVNAEVSIAVDSQPPELSNS